MKSQILRRPGSLRKMYFHHGRTGSSEIYNNFPYVNVKILCK